MLLRCFFLWKCLVECYLDAFFVFFTFKISFIKKNPRPDNLNYYTTVLLSFVYFVAKKWYILGDTDVLPTSERTLPLA